MERVNVAYLEFVVDVLDETGFNAHMDARELYRRSNKREDSTERDDKIEELGRSLVVCLWSVRVGLHPPWFWEVPLSCEALRLLRGCPNSQGCEC